MSRSRTSRRAFVRGLGAAGLLSGLAGLRPRVWAISSPGRPHVLAGDDFDLTIARAPVDLESRSRTALTVNGTLPGPLLRWREGDTVTLRVRNHLEETTSIHWHGIILPADMDGVPGLSFDGIAPADLYRYRFEVKQNGTYWYHSHSAFQEQSGVYGPLVIDAHEPEPFTYDRDYVVMLTDWTDEEPLRLLAKLKKQSDYYNLDKRTVADLVGDVRERGWRATLADRWMWARMRMSPSDIADVTGHTYTYLMNGLGPLGNWTGLFRPGERIRLRFINGSAMTHFDVRIPGLPMTVVAADGLHVRPVTVDEFRIAVAETYDVIVEPAGSDAYTVFAQAMDRTGYARGTLARREGLAAPLPELDPRPVLSMADLGMRHGDQPRTVHHGPQDHGSMHHAHPPRAAAAPQAHPESERGNPLVDMQVSLPAARLDDPGLGLRDNGRRVLTYADLRSRFPQPDDREPARTIELHLTGHMEKFSWSFDGIEFSGAEPLRFAYGERLRIVLVNDTMMAHPIHLHGMWSDLEDEHGRFLVRKHTIDMPPGTRRSYRVTADALGRWAYHCHLLFHMETGMFREVRVEA